MIDNPSRDGQGLTAGGVARTEAHTEPKSSGFRLHVYSSVLVVAPILYLLVCLALMRSDFMLRRTQNTYIANMGYGLKLHHADCEVVLYGDSSALIGLDPETVQRITGLSACNVADYAGMLRLSGTMVLDRYLANNARPKYLVILLSPDGFAPSWRHDGNYEAVLMRVKERPDLGFLLSIVRHGEDVLSAIGVSGRFAITDLLRRPLAAAVFHEREVTRGRFPDPKPPLTACPTDIRRNTPDLAWANQLRERYSATGIHVLLDVVPVPPCEPALADHEREFARGNGISDNGLQIYPLRWYTQSGRWHLGVQEGWEHLSSEVAGQINLLQQKGTAN